MTRKEAIETLKANYPDKCYESLCEAVDVAIKSLDAWDELLEEVVAYKIAENKNNDKYHTGRMIALFTVIDMIESSMEEVGRGN